MKILILLAAFAAVSANNADGTSFCPDSYADLGLEWPEAKPGIVCRCIPAADSFRDFADCTVHERISDCSNAFADEDGGKCMWSVYDWSADELATGKPANVDEGQGWVNRDGTVTDCSGQSFTAEDCKYKDKYDCMMYLGDGVCDFGQRYTDAGVRTGPNFACAKFGADKGDCDCKDTLTCDGYCLDDASCAKEAYGFTTCADWYNDNTCDFGQRTSDLGVSMNFDCHITDDIASVSGVDHRHDHGFCDEWDWHTRYDQQTLLDNFKPECPEPQPTHEPTSPPTEEVVDRCMEDMDCYCPKMFADGNIHECCNVYPDYKVGEDDGCPIERFNCASFSKKRNECEEAGFDHCVFNKQLPKDERCYTRPITACTTRKDDGSWDKRECGKLGDPPNNCFWAKIAGLKTVDVDGDEIPDEGTGMCLQAGHACNAYYTNKMCQKKAAKDGHLCEWNAAEMACEEMQNAECSNFNKKKDCKQYDKTLGCRYGKKAGKDKPKGQPLPGGINFDEVNCYHWKELCGVEGQDECPVCNDDDPNCRASWNFTYKKPAKEKKEKFKSCPKTGKDRDSCLKLQKKYNCYWWEDGEEKKHDGSNKDKGGCFEAGLVDGRL